MIPEFDIYGNLPSGVHSIAEVEFLKHFGTSSARRRWLAERFQEFITLAKSTGHMKHLYVWGSFASAKESPQDIDVLLVMNDEFVLDDVPEGCKILFEHNGAKMKFCMDVFWTKSSIGDETIKMWLDTYQTAKDFKRRGILEVKTQ